MLSLHKGTEKEPD